MYCPKCGKENSSTAKFCTGCATPLVRKSPPVSTLGDSRKILNKLNVNKTLSTSFTSFNSSSISDKTLAVVSIILALLSLLPWLQADMFAVNEAYTIFGLPGQLEKEKMFVKSASDFQNSMIFAWGIVAVLAACIALLVTNAIRIFVGKKSLSFPFLVMGIFACLIIAFVFFAASSLGSSSVVTLSATPWAWITAIASLSAFFVNLKLKKA